MSNAPIFGPAFEKTFGDLLTWRRDVRRFRSDMLPDGLLTELMSVVALSPSVGLSEPWRFVEVCDPQRRSRVARIFEQANRDALAGYEDERAGLYARLRLAGLNEAPLHLAVFSDHASAQGSGLGRRTMPETLDYSVVLAIHTLWLAARLKGIGLGWVSIVDPQAVTELLDVPQGWRLIAYLCLGFPESEESEPELQREGWERRAEAAHFLIRR